MPGKKFRNELHDSVLFWAQNFQIPVAGQFECEIEMGCMSKAGETAFELETGKEVLCCGSFPG